MNKKGVCELCGFADNSYSIEDNGNILKVCKFCHDGYLEQMGLPPESNAHKDITLTMDIGGEQNSAQSVIDENITMKVPALDEAELSKMLTSSPEDKKVIYQALRKAKRKADANAEAELEAEAYTKTVPLQTLKNETIYNQEIYKEDTVMTTKQAKEIKRRDDIHAAANQSIDDERIKITSPEVELPKDRRPKTNLDVAVSEYAGGVRFIDSFKYVFNRIVFAVLLAIIAVAVCTVLFITDTWQNALIVLGTSVIAITLSFLLMWYMVRCLKLDKRALLLRIRQQEILFASMNSDCYRELKTKYTVLKSLNWLLSKLSLILSLAAIVGTLVCAVVLTFMYNVYTLPIGILASMVAGILVYWMVKFCADIVSYKLDIERNQQIQQQTMLDLLLVTKHDVSKNK